MSVELPAACTNSRRSPMGDDRGAPTASASVVRPRFPRTSGKTDVLRDDRITAVILSVGIEAGRSRPAFGGRRGPRRSVVVVNTSDSSPHTRSSR